MQPTVHRICECETVPTGSPSRYDAYQEGEMTLPNPNCPVHTYDDDYLRDVADMIEQEYNLIRCNDGEWVPTEEWDEETGDRKDPA